MTDIGDFGAFSVNLYKASVRLAGGTDTVYIIARHMEDAVQQIRQAYTDMNFLYVASLERLAGSIFISEEAKSALEPPSD